jgi:hypothetical protein
MKTGTAPYSSWSLFTRGPASESGTSRPGQPYHWKVVVLDSPLRPETSPPDDMEKAYEPSSERLIVMGSRFDTRSNLPWRLGSWTTEGIVRAFVRLRRRGSRGLQVVLTAILGGGMMRFGGKARKDRVDVAFDVELRSFISNHIDIGYRYGRDIWWEKDVEDICGRLSSSLAVNLTLT